MCREAQKNVKKQENEYPPHRPVSQKMDYDSSGKWIHAFIYLAIISASIHLLHTLLISPSFTVNHLNARIKKVSPTPLRFRSDGTFKILQVIPNSQYRNEFVGFFPFNLSDCYDKLIDGF